MRDSDFRHISQADGCENTDYPLYTLVNGLDGESLFSVFFFGAFSAVLQDNCAFLEAVFPYQPDPNPSGEGPFPVIEEQSLFLVKNYVVFYRKRTTERTIT